MTCKHIHTHQSIECTSLTLSSSPVHTQLLKWPLIKPTNVMPFLFTYLQINSSTCDQKTSSSPSQYPLTRPDPNLHPKKSKHWSGRCYLIHCHIHCYCTSSTCTQGMTCVTDTSSESVSGAKSINTPTKNCWADP